jgi:2-polyprenyl-3-methyl-5-hydroxy-6-metoxy-1,4-benzoquinol methylase
VTQRRDAYAGFAGHYDLHGWDWYAATYGERLFRLLEERGLPGARVLDAGCGTGTLALALARRGHRVTGFDLSEAMLEAARRKDPAGSVAWRRADVTRFDLGETFDAAVCVADILNHLESLEEWEQALRCLAAHLRAGGLLFLDVMTCLGLERLDGYTVREAPGSALIVGSIYERSSRRSTVKVTSFARMEGGEAWERASDTITEWGQPAGEILERLARSGFGGIERPFATREDPEDEDRLAVLARREGT